MSFLIESSNECLPNAFDCFPTAVNNTLPYSIDCSEFPNVADIMCFRFIVDFGKGFTDAIGFFTVNVVIFCTITWVLLALSGGKDGKRRQKDCTCFICVLIVLFSLFIFSLVSGIIIINAKSQSLYNVFSQLLLVTAVFFVAILSSMVPWYQFKTERTQNDDYTTIPQYPVLICVIKHFVNFMKQFKKII